MSEEIRHEVPRKDIVSFRCGGCGHIFTDPLSAEDAATIYECLYRYYPYSGLESMHAPYRQPFEEFFAMMVEGPLKARFARCRMLEVGCSAEEELAFFEGLGFEATGADPGVPESRQGGKLLRCYYESHTFSDRFDAVVSRFVLEHANSAVGFLTKNRADLAESGVAFVQVPNVLKYVEDFVPLFLAHEHINYFNANSLSCAVRRAGFEIEGLLCGESPSLIAGLSKGGAASPLAREVGDSAANVRIQDSLDRFLAAKESVGAQVREFLEDRPDVCLYGAGLCLAWILYELGLVEQLDRGILVDDNRAVWGLFMPNTDLKIHGPEDVDWEQVPEIFLTLSPIYHEIVANRLRKGGYRGTINAVARSGMVRLES